MATCVCLLFLAFSVVAVVAHVFRVVLSVYVWAVKDLTTGTLVLISNEVKVAIRTRVLINLHGSL